MNLDPAVGGTMKSRSMRRVSKANKFGLSGVIMVALGRGAAAGRLPRNLFAGIRLPSTLRSDEAWHAGHLAAASALTVSGVGPIAVATIVGATRPGPRAQAVLFRIGSAWLLGWLGRATFLASRAARAEDVS
ncbi:MAG: SdpI family protein [Acidimicrobiales bacterium]|jgi:hypothetical protein